MKKTGQRVVREDLNRCFTDVDIIFVLFKSNDRLKYFQEFLISCHINMSFSMETERQNKFSFEIIREQGKFSTTIYRKPLILQNKHSANKESIENSSYISKDHNILKEVLIWCK